MKAKLGISVGLVGAALYFSGLFGGYLVAVLLAGYVLLCEDNLWLKRTAVKAVALLIIFYLLVWGIELLPQMIGIVDSIANIFHHSVSVFFISALRSALTAIVYFVKDVLFILLGVKALSQGTIAVPVVDGLINKHMA